MGANADLLPLEDAGIVGNGPGLILEANSDTVKPVIAWLDRLDAGMSGSTGRSR